MTHQDLRPLFEDSSAPHELRNFVALARSDGPSQADLERLATRVGHAVGVSAGVLLAGSVAGAAALGTPPAQLAVAVQSGLAPKLGMLGKLFASSGGKLLAVGLSAGVGVGVWTYARPQQSAHEARAPQRAPVAGPVEEPPAEPELESPRPAEERRAQPVETPEARLAPPPMPTVTPLAPDPIRAAAARGAPSRTSARRAAVTERLAAPVKEAPAAAQESEAAEELAQRPQPPQPPAVDLPSELSLIQQAEAARHRGAEALQLLATHERLYPRGALAQEREVLAIELLLKIGKPKQAHERAARFERSHPSSAHLPRVRALLERADDE